MHKEVHSSYQENTNEREQRLLAVSELVQKWDVPGLCFYPGGSEPEHPMRIEFPTTKERENLIFLIDQARKSLDILKQGHDDQLNEFEKLLTEGTRAGIFPVVSFSFPPVWLQLGEGEEIFLESGVKASDGSSAEATVIKVPSAIMQIVKSNLAIDFLADLISDNSQVQDYLKGQNSRPYVPRINALLKLVQDVSKEQEQGVMRPSDVGVDAKHEDRSEKDKEKAGIYWERLRDQGSRDSIFAMKEEMKRDLLGMAQSKVGEIRFRRRDDESADMFRERLSAIRIVAIEAGLDVGNFVRDEQDKNYFILQQLQSVHQLRDAEPNLNLDHLLVETYWEKTGLNQEEIDQRKEEWRRKMEINYIDGRVIPVRVLSNETGNDLLTKEAAMRFVAYDAGFQVVSEQVPDGYVLHLSKSKEEGK